MSDDEPDCTCPLIMFEDPPCPVHGPRKCADCGRDAHDFISCATAKGIAERGSTQRHGEDK